MVLQLVPLCQLSDIAEFICHVNGPKDSGDFRHNLVNCFCKPSPSKFGHAPNCQSWDERCDCWWCWGHRVDTQRGFDPQVWPPRSGVN